MVGATGIEPVTPTMSRWCSSAELRARTFRSPAGPRHIGSRHGRGKGRRLSQAVRPPSIRSHLGDDLAQMDRLGQHLGVLGRRRVPALSATAAKPVMNMILRSGSSSAARRASSMPSISGHDDVGQQQLERLLAQPLIGADRPLSNDDHVVAGVLQRLHQETPHVVVVFGKDYLAPSSSPLGRGELPPPLVSR